MLALLSQVVVARDNFAGPVHSWSIGEMLIALVIIGGAVGIAIVAMKEFGLAFPQWLLRMLGIVAVVVVAIVLIRFVLAQ